MCTKKGENMKKKLVVVGMLAAIAGVVAVFKSRKKYTKVRKNYGSAQDHRL